MYCVLENIEEKIIMGELNNKLNYSYLLICSLSHELFTPINHLVGHAESLCRYMDKTPSVPANVKEEATLLSSSSNLMIYLVQNILDFARYINKSLNVSIEPVNIKAEILAFMDLFAVKVKRKNIRLKVEIDESLEIETDREKMLGLLLVFVENSLRYTSTGGIDVVVKKGSSPRFVRFEIHDTGVGIGEDDLDKLANILRNPFENIQTNGAAGIGIGIRIAQVLLLQLSGGEMAIKIKSIKGAGTVIKYDILRRLKQNTEYRKYNYGKESNEALRRDN